MVNIPLSSRMVDGLSLYSHSKTPMVYCCRSGDIVGDDGGTVDVSSGSRVLTVMAECRCSTEDIISVGYSGDVGFGVSIGIDISLFK